MKLSSLRKLFQLLLFSFIILTGCFRSRELREVDANVEYFRQNIVVGMKREAIHEAVGTSLLVVTCDWTQEDVPPEYRGLTEYYLVGELSGAFRVLGLDYEVRNDGTILTDIWVGYEEWWLPNEDGYCSRTNITP